MNPNDLYSHPNALAPHYSRFRVGERLLLTGHSHQAWPDRAMDGQVAAFDDAARLVDGKWERALEQADRVRAGFARLLDDPDGSGIALGANTHELVVRLLSALPLLDRPRVVTTDGEFHSLRRQLLRLEEEGLEVVREPADDPLTLAERLAERVDGRTCAVMVSSVLFRSGLMVDGLGELLQACLRQGVALVVDAYHSVNVAPFSIRELGLEQAYVLGGGYKYCQLGEGNCFLRLPAAGLELRPAITGWFAEMDDLAATDHQQVSYGAGPERFSGSTYDPASHYRAAEVFAFFQEQGLTPALLRQVSQHQIGLLLRELEAQDMPPRLLELQHEVSLSRRAGFLALRSPLAAQIRDEAARRGVHVDHRGAVLRLGPAPYLSDRQLSDAAGIIGEAVRSLEK